MVRDGKIQKDLGRVLGAKERRNAEKRAVEEADVGEEDDDEENGGGPTGEPLEYYDDLADSDGVGAAATIFL